ncbi:MAG: coproporphyrinogen-III oxidase family protein [Methylococcaceae bacterium]|nr:coproporphyrinogen-III oxidase family protein [Methylococcaceae bacterium]
MNAVKSENQSVSSVIDAAMMSAAQRRVDDFKRLRQLGMLPKDGDFFPSVHYPPITMYPPTTEDELFQGYTVPADGLFDVYVHIPFCLQRCTFCHYPVKLGKNTSDEKDRYLVALAKEMSLYRARLGLVDRIKARSILVGGGTPTFLNIPQMRYFFEFFNENVEVAEGTQFNYDVDPNTLLGEEGRQRLQIMKDNGVNRLTIGVQSLNDEVLFKMNRHHSAEQAIDSIRVSREMGFQVNIEFIYGYPGETLENWAAVIEQAAQLDVEEIQMYRLKVEAYGDYQGPIKNVKEKHPERIPEIDETLEMKQIAIEILNKHGYHENLRRVYSRKPEHYSHYAHNQCCMLYDEVGFGLTAFSSLRDRFALNTQYFDEYYSLIDSGKLPINRGIVRTKEEQQRWAIVLPLKNRTVRKRDFQRATGESIEGKFSDKFAALKEHGLIEETEREIKLTPLGCFFADEVVQQFHQTEFMPFPETNYEPGPLCPYHHNHVD